MITVPWSAHQAALVRDHLLACQRGNVALHAFDEDDHAALERLIEKTMAAIQVALEEAGVRVRQ